MKKLLYFMAIVAGIAIVAFSCETQEDSVPQAEDALYKAKKAKNKIKICHLNDQGNWNTISININALPAHLAHGDMVVFPNIATYTWYFTAGQTYQHTMYITEMSDGTFSGHGFLNSNPGYTWVLEDGMYDDAGNVSFTIIYTGAFAGYTWDCTGIFACGEGTSGIADGVYPDNAPDGTWTIAYLGN